VSTFTKEDVLAYVNDAAVDTTVQIFADGAGFSLSISETDVRKESAVLKVVVRGCEVLPETTIHGGMFDLMNARRYVTMQPVNEAKFNEIRRIAETMPDYCAAQELLVAHVATEVILQHPTFILREWQYIAATVAAAQTAKFHTPFMMTHFASICFAVSRPKACSQISFSPSAYGMFTTAAIASVRVAMRGKPCPVLSREALEVMYREADLRTKVDGFVGFLHNKDSFLLEQMFLTMSEQPLFCLYAAAVLDPFVLWWKNIEPHICEVVAFLISTPTLTSLSEIMLRVVLAPLFVSEYF
jgi:hypothetical protein